jgi:hypothetical protein
MAKGAAKGETNAQRHEREYNRRTTLGMAKWIADTICERRKSKADLAPGNCADLSAQELKKLGWHLETKRWIKTYTWLGQVLCEFCPFDEPPSKFLRLVADFLEGKPSPYSPADHCGYNSEITKAYGETLRRRQKPTKKNQEGFVEITRPSFSEFFDVFREQNPTLFKPRANRPEGSGPSARSLRRSLERLGYRTRPDKRGRPRKK